METLRGYRFELDPNDRQRTQLTRAAGLARFVWNWGLAARQDHYEQVVKPARERGEKVSGLSRFDQINAWNAVKDEVAPWAREHSSRIAEYALDDLEAAYAAWFRGLKTKRRVGRPRFKVKDRSPARFRTRGGVSVDANGVSLPRIGRLRIKGKTCRVPDDATIRFATVSERAGRWYVSLTVRETIAEPVTPVGEPVGIDVGLAHSVVLSTGDVIESPRVLRANLARLRRAQKALSRSQRNSARRKKDAARVARLHARVANVRSAWLHGVSNRLTREHAVIGHEDLALAGLIRRRRGFRHARAWSDLGAGELFRQLAYKAAWRGVTIVTADRSHPSSQLCSGCGAQNRALTLKDRTFSCPACGLLIDRDHNAALNLRPVAVMPTETLNARRGGVSPGSETTWQLPLKREPSPAPVALAAA
jgi:putative transposase